MSFKNNSNISLPVAVWLASNADYDLLPDPNVLSATTLQRPIRSLILSRRLYQEQEVDLEMTIPAKIGSAVHYAAEMAWKNDYPSAMRNLGYPENTINRVVINAPRESDYPDDSIFIYIEQRIAKEIDGFIISGKFDFVIEGELHDLKTTKTYSYITKSNEGDYRLQGSIYRWLNPDIITGNHVHINYIFTDWTPTRAMADPEYPKSRVLTIPIQLYSLQETEAYIRERIALLKKYENAAQSEIPLCSPRELWQELPTYAVYKNPQKTARATKLFDLAQDAMQFNAAECKGQGLIVKREGNVKRCLFCEGRPVCTQAESLQLKGLLK